MKVHLGLVYTLLVSLGISIFIFLDYKNTTIPYDDAYSIFMIKASYADIVRITAKDVHPPLYYWALKAFSSIAGNSLFSLRLFSALGMLASLLLGCFTIRKLFGDRTAILCLVLIIIFPVSHYLTTDIRMYSWTMFFVLACSLYAYKVYLKSRTWDWILFFITGICAAYLHNYGLMSIFGIYCILLVSLVRSKQKWHYLIASGILFFLLYSPWLLQLVRQLRDVAADYWINPLTLNDLYLHIYYFYSPKEIWQPFTHFSKIEMMIGLILLMAIQLILIIYIIKKEYKNKDNCLQNSFIYFIAFIFPILTGAFISIVATPILVTRYMTCSFGLYILSLSLLFSKALDYKYGKSLLYCFLLLLFIDSGIRTYSDMSYYSQIEKAYDEIRNFSKKGNKTHENYLVNEFSYHVVPRLQLIAPDNAYYVLTQKDISADVKPFVLSTVATETDLGKEFVLIHQSRDAIQANFRDYRERLGRDYFVTDSLYASDIYLYRMVDKQSR